MTDFFNLRSHTHMEKWCGRKGGLVLLLVSGIKEERGRNPTSVVFNVLMVHTREDQELLEILLL